MLESYLFSKPSPAFIVCRFFDWSTLTGVILHCIHCPRSGCQNVQFLARTLLQFADCQLLVISSHGGEQSRARKLSSDSFQVTNPFMRGIHSFLMTSSNPYHLPQRSHLLIPSYWGVKFQQINFGKAESFSSFNIQFITLRLSKEFLELTPKIKPIKEKNWYIWLHWNFKIFCFKDKWWHF